MKVLRSLFAVVLALAIAGCGFQLRGTPNWPTELSPIRVEGLESRDPLYLLLAQSLTAAGLEVLPPGSDGKASELRVLDLRDRRRVLSVTGEVEVAEYELVRSLETELRLPGEPEPVPLGRLEARQAYTFEAASVLSEEETEEELRRVMNRDLVRLLQFRVRAATAAWKGSKSRAGT